MSRTLFTANRLVASLYLIIVLLALSVGYLVTHASEHQLEATLSVLQLKHEQHKKHLLQLSQPMQKASAQVAFAWQLSKWVDELGLTLSLQPVTNKNSGYTVAVMGATQKLQQLLRRASQQAANAGWNQPVRSQILSFMRQPDTHEGRLNWQLTAAEQERFLKPLRLSDQLSQSRCKAPFNNPPKPHYVLAELRLAAIVTATNEQPFAYWQSTAGDYVKTTIGQRFTEPDAIITAIHDTAVELDQSVATGNCNTTTKRVITL